MTTCTECGMVCSPCEYHPYAACLMFKACHNGKTVRGNLQAVRDDALKAIEEARVEAEKLGNALRLAFDHIDMDTLRVSHCKDAAAIDAAIRIPMNERTMLESD